MGKDTLYIAINSSRALPEAPVGRPTANEMFDAELEKDVESVGRGERRCIGKGRQWFRRDTQREFAREQ